MMKAAGSAVFVWTGAQSAVWASHSGDSAFDENWRVAAKAMQLGVTCDGRHRCPPSAKTYDAAGYLLSRHGCCVGCFVTRDVGESDAFRLVANICDRYEAQFGSMSTTAQLPEPSRVVPLLREATTQFNSRSAMASIRAKVEDVKSTMTANIERVLDRGERLDDMAVKTESMRSQAEVFRAKGRSLRRQMWWQNVKWTLLLLSITALVAFIIFLAACRGFQCVK